MSDFIVFLVLLPLAVLLGVGYGFLIRFTLRKIDCFFDKKRSENKGDKKW